MTAPSDIAPPADLEWLPREGRAELLFLLFHGVGAAAQDMAPLAQRLVAEYPQAAVICVQAQERFERMPGGGKGWQWFSVRGVSEDNRPARVAAALPAFIATVRALSARFDLPWQRVALAGFSQGAVMALEAVQAEPALAGRVLAFAGRHASAPMHAPVDTTLHLLHGLDDRVMPPGPVIDAAERLVALGGDVTADLLPGIGHELHARLIDKAIDHLHSFLPKRAWREALGEAPLRNRRASSRELG